MRNTIKSYTDDEKKEILRTWQASGLSLNQWQKQTEGAPGLSTLYRWMNQLGDETISTDPKIQPSLGSSQDASTPSEPDEPEASQERAESPGGVRESGETGDSVGTDDRGGSAEKNETREEEEDVILKDRVEHLEPVTVPEPKEEKEKDEVTLPGKPNVMGIAVFVGGALLVIGGGALVYRMLKKRAGNAEKIAPKKDDDGGNPFEQYVTIDKY